MSYGERIPIKTRREIEVMREAVATSRRSCWSCGPGGARHHDPGARPPRGEGDRAAGRGVVVQGLRPPRPAPIPGRALRLGERRDRPRDPRVGESSRKATSSASISVSSVDGYHGDSAVTIPSGGRLRGAQRLAGHVTRARCGAASSRWKARAIASRTSVTPCRALAEAERASRWCGCSRGTASAASCTSRPGFRTTGARARAAADARHGARDRAHGERGSDPVRMLDDEWTAVTADGRCRRTSSTRF